MAASSSLSDLLNTAVFPSPMATVTEAPPTTEDPIQRHLSAIIGVPVGVGLSIIILGTCALWLFLTSYFKYRREEREIATNVTNLNSSKGGGGSKQMTLDDSNRGVVSSPTTSLSPPSPFSPS